MTLDELIDALLATRTTSVTDERAQRQLAPALVRTACALLLGGCHMLDVRDKDEYLGMGWDST